MITDFVNGQDPFATESETSSQAYDVEEMLDDLCCCEDESS